MRIKVFNYPKNTIFSVFRLNLRKPPSPKTLLSVLGVSKIDALGV